jgi:hypothetical protein
MHRNARVTLYKGVGMPYIDGAPHSRYKLCLFTGSVTQQQQYLK